MLKLLPNVCIIVSVHKKRASFIWRATIYARNASNTLFSTLSQTLTILLGEINVCPTTLSGFYFQNVGPTLI